MEPTKRIIVNTIAQYTKAVINICLSLYSTRLVLDVLSISDYGIYSVVGGLVAMLGFITNALVITTQRYISYYHGQGDKTYVSRLFTNSLFLHTILGLLMVIILIALKEWLFSGILNIDPDRVDVAQKVYYITIFMLLTTILMAPFKALFIARENIVYISVVEVCDGIIKLLLVIGLAFINADKLLVYALMMAFIQILNFLAFSIYARWRFIECHFRIRRRDIDFSAIKQLAGFAGWTTYGAGALAARTQGTAVIINHFVGTVANAAYGVAAQVNYAIFFVSSSIVNAMNPQIMKAEGAGDRKKVLALASQESKYSAILLSIVSIPLLMELPSILSFWLKEVPADTAMFSTFTLVTCLVDQFTIGLNAVNQAQGKIGVYSLLMFTPKLINLPIVWFLLSENHSLMSVMWSILFIEAIVAIIRLPFLKYTAGLNMSLYIRNTILPVLPLILTLVIVSWGCTKVFHFYLSFILTVFISILTGIATAWLFSLSREERQYITLLIKNRVKKDDMGD